MFNNNNKKPPTFWEKLKAFLRRHSSSLLLFPLTIITVSLLLNVFFPDYLPAPYNELIDATFCYYFNLAVRYGETLVYLDKVLPDVLPSAQSRERTKQFTTFLIEEVPDPFVAFGYVIKAGACLVDLMTVLLLPSNPGTWEWFFFRWIEPFWSFLHTKWFEWTGLPDKISGSPNLYMKWVLQTSFREQHVMFTYHELPFPWEQIPGSFRMPHPMMNLLLYPQYGHYSCFQLFYLTFALFDFNTPFWVDPSSYVFFFQNNPYLALRFLIFLNYHDRTLPYFTFTHENNGDVQIQPTAVLEETVVFEPDYLKVIEADQNWHTLFL